MIGKDWTISGRIGFVSGTGRNGVTVSINPDHTEGAIIIGGERCEITDPTDIDALMRHLRTLRTRLRPNG